MDLRNQSEKTNTINNLKYELEENLYSLSRMFFKTNSAENPFSKFMILRNIIEYCEAHKTYLNGKKSDLGITEDNIFSLIEEVSFQIRGEVEKLYSSPSAGKNVILSPKPLNNKRFSEDEVENEAVQHHNIPMEFYEDKNWDSKEYHRFSLDSTYEPENSLIKLTEFGNEEDLTFYQSDIELNAWFYRYCYSPDTFKFYLAERYRREFMKEEVKSDVEWSIEADDPISFIYFKDYFEKNRTDLEDSRNYWENYFDDDIYPFSVNYHYFEENRLLEILSLENDLAKFNNLNYPIVRSFAVYIKNHLPYSLFTILYEPFIEKFTLNEIFKSGTGKILYIANEIDELLEALLIRQSKD